MKQFLEFLTIFLLGIYILYLNFFGKLLLLIHSRYIWLSLFCGSILAIVGAIGLILQMKNFWGFSKESRTKILQPVSILRSISCSNFVIVLVVVSMFFLPIKSLSIDSFYMRKNKSTPILTEEEKAKLKAKLSGNLDTSGFGFVDWISAKYLGDNKVFEGKKFRGHGFVVPTNAPNRFEISRFVISCCVVDATPVSLIVEYNYNGIVGVNDWVEVEGVFETKNIDGASSPVIVPTSLIKIPEPSSPYLGR